MTFSFAPAPVDGGFSDPDYWTWCGSPIKAPDGTYHLFASRWPRDLPFFTGYKVASEVVRAEASTPEGPYHFAERVLADRGEEFWDGRMTHNPTIIRAAGKYLLFYIGATYPGPRPGQSELAPDDPTAREAGVWSDTPGESYATIRIGCAVADHPAGPWARPDAPCLSARQGMWDSTVVTNPAVVQGQTPDTLLLFYRSNTPDGLRLGVARGTLSAALSQVSPGAASWSGDLGFARLSDEPLLTYRDGQFVEDPFVWRQKDGTLAMIAKDMRGGITGEAHAGVSLVSEDGIAWQFDDPVRAYGRTVRWDDGRVTTQSHLERPQLLFDDPDRPHVPTHLFAATADGTPGTWVQSRTWTMVLPLDL